MFNSITVQIENNDGIDIDLRIVGEHSHPKGYGLEHADVYSIWRYDDEPAGFFTFSKDKSVWEYAGDLTPEEQDQVISIIRDYNESDYDLD